MGLRPFLGHARATARALGCGGVTDAATAKKLAELEKSFHAESCRFTHNCAAWSCVPTCVAGRCAH